MNKAILVIPVDDHEVCASIYAELVALTGRPFGAGDLLVVTGAPADIEPAARVVPVFVPHIERVLVPRPTTVGSSIHDMFASFEASLLELPAEQRAALERFDPGGEAIVIADENLRAPALWGRRRIALRPDSGCFPDAWTQLENKIRLPGLLRETAPHRPTRIVPLDREELEAAFATIDEGSGCVLSDHRYQTGGRAVFRAADASALDRARSFFEQRGATCVRIMPMVTGIPIVVHAAVSEDDVVVFRPDERLVVTSSSRFIVLGWSGHRDFESTPYRAIADATVRLGETLRARFGFRGVFNVDGTLTEDGFYIFDLNPRAAHAGRGRPPRPTWLHLHDLDVVLRNGLAPGAPLREIATAWSEHARRHGGITISVPDLAERIDLFAPRASAIRRALACGWNNDVVLPLKRTSGGFAPVAEAPDLVVRVAESGIRVHVSNTLHDELAAPSCLLAQLLECLDETFALGFDGFEHCYGALRHVG